MFYPPCQLIDRHKRSTLEGLFGDDFKIDLPNDPQSNPEALTNILIQVLGKLLLFFNKFTFIVVKI